MLAQDNRRLSWALTTLPSMTLQLRGVGLLQIGMLYHIAAFAAQILPAAILDPRGLRWVLPAVLALGLAIEIPQPIVGREASNFAFLGC